MPDKCSVFGCKGNYASGKKVSVFQFPKEPQLLQTWISRVMRDNFTPTKHSRICELHFRKEDILHVAEFFDEKSGRLLTSQLKIPRLRAGAIPVILPAYCPAHLQPSVTPTQESPKKCVSEPHIDQKKEDSSSDSDDVDVPPSATETPNTKGRSRKTLKRKNVNLEEQLAQVFEQLHNASKKPRRNAHGKDENIMGSANSVPDLASSDVQSNSLPDLPSSDVQSDCSPDLPNTDVQSSPNRLNTIGPIRRGRMMKQKRERELDEVIASFGKRLRETTAEDQHDVFGKNVAHKLRNLPNNQRIFLEQIINDAIFRAESGRLSKDCCIHGHRSGTTSVNHDIAANLELQLTTGEPDSDHEMTSVPKIRMKQEIISDPEDAQSDWPEPDVYSPTTLAVTASCSGAALPFTPILSSVTSLSKPSTGSSESGEILGVPVTPARARSPTSMSSSVSEVATNSGLEKCLAPPHSTVPTKDPELDPKLVLGYKTRRDQFDVYGEYIASKLRRLDWRTCAHVQKAFGDIIFEAEMGKYSQRKDYANSAVGS